MKRLTPVLIVLLCVGGALGTLYFLWSKSKTRPVPARLELPELRDIVKKTVATGAIVPREEVEIKPRVSGVIEELFVEAGAPIKAGDQLARIRIVPDAASLQRAQSAVQAARIANDTARRELDRNQALFSQGVISGAELDRFKTDLALKQQELASANEGLQIVKEGQSRGAGKQSNIVVTSTVDGMVIDVPVKLGFSVIESNNFNPGTTIAIVADMSDMIFQGQVDESEVGKIKVGLPLDIKIGALEKEVFEGKLEHIAPKGKEIDGAIQFEIKASVTPKKDVFVRAGYSANADVVLDRRTQVLAVREALLQWKEGKPYVEVETSKGVFARRDVKLGLSDGIYAEVLEGVDKDTKIKQPQNAGPPDMGGGRRGGPARGGRR
ncbi:MAG: efflux RND transporter periplasmic adaptor subunit [Deltaproteobacteria bacterium]|nr:efflux RND transporter periplasmic adaptor subunit [Kofleriaceae bacterium]